METYNEIKNKLLDVNDDIRQVIHKAQSVDGLASDHLEGWEAATDQIEKQLAEETVRLAVVGSVKSGKSTLVNALFGGDYVKRGAGVVTSIITRIRPGNDTTAKLEFKTWHEINSEINQALILFSSTEPETAGGSFDINREKDRLWLQQEVSKLNAEQLIAEDTRDANSVLLTEYLKGYDRAKAFVSFEPTTQILDSDSFHKQKDFVGDESMAVYLKDICLTLTTPEEFGENLEMADCQGSDSPNPLHLAMIQDYLIQTNLIIYVISSRTGIRQADIKFLNLIKKMGLTKNILFVVNCDFNEHETLADMKGLVSRVREEINMIVSSPRVFAFSALYNLFDKVNSKSRSDQALSAKDRRRLELWQEETDMVTFSDQEKGRFLKMVMEKMSMDRFALLLESNLERISNIALSAQDWIQMSRELMLKSTGEVWEAFAEMDKRRQASKQVIVVIKDTLDGTTGKLKRDLGTDVDRFFDVKYSEVGQQIIGFVDSYDISIGDYEKDLQTSGFLPTLYRIFKTLQQGVNRFIVESVNPKLIEFLRQAEHRGENVYKEVCGTYSLMIQDAIEQHHRTAEKFGINVPNRPFKEIRAPEVALVKRDARLSVPRLTTTMQYTLRIKTEAILKLGFYTTLKATKRLFRRPVTEGGGSYGAVRSLEDSVRSMKEQMRESIMAHFMDYKENLKYQYLFKLADAMSTRLYEDLTDRVMHFTGNLSHMRNLMENEHQAKDQLGEQFSSMERLVTAALEKIRNMERLAENHSQS